MNRHRKMAKRPWPTERHAGKNKLCGRPPQHAPPPVSWPLTFWPWKWCPSHVWRGLPVPILVFLGLCSRLRPDVRDRQTDLRHASLLNAPAMGRGIIIYYTITTTGATANRSRVSIRLGMSICCPVTKILAPRSNTRGWCVVDMYKHTPPHLSMPHLIIDGQTLWPHVGCTPWAQVALNVRQGHWSDSSTQ